MFRLRAILFSINPSSSFCKVVHSYVLWVGDSWNLQYFPYLAEVKEESNSLPERLTVTEPNSFLCSIGSTRYSGFHSIKTWGTSWSFSNIAQKKTKLAPLQRQMGTGIGLQEILGRVPLFKFGKGTRFTQAKLLAAQEYATSTGLPVPRNVLIPRIKVLVLGQPGEEVRVQLILRVVADVGLLARTCSICLGFE
nr:hypothetical protein CISIN_1g0379581mg [Ipomoea trifida]